jgi:hypothetical protein
LIAKVLFLHQPIEYSEAVNGLTAIKAWAFKAICPNSVKVAVHDTPEGIPTVQVASPPEMLVPGTRCRLSPALYAYPCS